MKCKLSWSWIAVVWVALVAGCATPTQQIVVETVIVTQSPPATYTPYPTWTPGQPLPTYTSPPTYTPHPTNTPRPTRTPRPTVTPTLTPRPTVTPTSTPTPTPRATSVPALTATPTPTLLQAPILLEPESGARFPDRVRFKWIWYRRLGENEKFAVRVKSIDGPDQFDWWVTEGGLLNSGGAIVPVGNQLVVSGGTVYRVQGGARFEVNGGLGPISPGAALWSVAVVGEMPSAKWQISRWSEQRLIYRVK